MSSDLPPQFQRLADFLSKEPIEVRELVHYLFAFALFDEEKAHIISTRHESGREYLQIETVAGDVFEIVKPRMKPRLERDLLKYARMMNEMDETAE